MIYLRTALNLSVNYINLLTSSIVIRVLFEVTKTLEESINIDEKMVMKHKKIK